MSQAGIINAGDSGGNPPGTISLINIPGATVNLKNLGNTTTFVTGNSPFFALDQITTNITLTGTPGNPVVNMGWTAPNYTDLISGATGAALFQGDIFYDSAFHVNGGILIPPNTTVVVRVTTADTSATSDTQQYSLNGYYL